MPEPATGASPARRYLAAWVAAGTLVTGCAPSPVPSTPAGDHLVWIDTRTPPGLRAQQTVDMLNSDLPIGPVGVATLATRDIVDGVTTTMESLWWDRPFRVTKVDIRRRVATLHLVASYGAGQRIELRTGDDGMVNGFRAGTEAPVISSWRDVDAVLTRTGAQYSYQAARIKGGMCEPVAGTATRKSLPLASIFKLYVLLAVAEAVRAGTMSWDEQLTVTSRAKAVGFSSGLDELPVGARVSVRAAAEKMIGISDNVATDLLIEKVGTSAVEKALTAAGHHDPAGMTPFPTMYELFSIGWGEPDLREQWRRASAPERARLLRQAGSQPYRPDVPRAHAPASEYGVEWYGNAEDICRVHVAVQRSAVGRAAPVKQIMSGVSGLGLDHGEWPYVGAKSGSLPGDRTFSWYAVDGAGQPWVLSFQLSWPRDFGGSVSSWMLQVAAKVFALLPTQR